MNRADYSPRPPYDVADTEILVMLPPFGSFGIWTVTIANTLNLASPGRRVKPRLIYNSLVDMEERGLASRDGRPASYLFTGWMTAQPSR